MTREITLTDTVSWKDLIYDPVYQSINAGNSTNYLTALLRDQECLNAPSTNVYLCSSHSLALRTDVFEARSDTGLDGFELLQEFLEEPLLYRVAAF